jgi:ATP-dependent protease ClpP protease subunit
VKDIDGLPKLYITGQIAPPGSFLMDLSGGPTFSSQDVINFLEQNKDATEIVVEVETNGGFKTEGIAIYNRLKNCGKKVYTIGYKVNSIGTVIFLSGTTRLVVEDVEFVTHFARIDPINLGVDPLTAADFQRLAEETERSDNQILDIYCRELGDDKRGELLAAMADEENLTAKGAIKLGFAHGYYKKKKKVENIKDLVSNKFAYTDFEAELIQNFMNTKQDDNKFKTLEDKVLNGFKAVARLLSGKMKNEVTLKLADGTSIYVEPADANAPEVLKGAKVYKLDDAGLPTDTFVDDGSYTLEDGRTLVVSSGVVTEEPVAAEDKSKEAEDLKAENQSLKDQVAALTAEKTAAEKKVTTVEAQVTALRKDFTDYQKAVTGDKKEHVNSKQSKDADVDPADFAKMSTRERVMVMAREKRAAEKARLSEAD